MKIYKVGGVIRDAVLEVQSTDVDYVVVGSTPEEMLAKGFSQVGADFPVFLDDAGEEYALARTEKKVAKGYNGFETYHDPSVSIEDDLFRRDLTINAMALPLEADSLDEIVDPFGGREDIEKKVLRHVSDAFAEDPVRVLRLARFHARYGPKWSIAPETIELCKKLVSSGELHHLTRERVLKEFEKALKERYSGLFLETLHSFGAYGILFPEFGYAMGASFALGTHWRSSPKLKYAVLSSSWIPLVDEFESRLNVSSDYRQYAKMYRGLLRAVRLQLGTVDALYYVDAYRRKDLFNEVMEDRLKARPNDEEFRLFKEAFKLTDKVGFEQLSEEDKQLSGKEIGEAIKKLRTDNWRLTLERKWDRLILWGV